MRNAAAHSRSRAWRSRWAAIGAAIAVTLGGSGLFVANAASSAVSDYVGITPTRVLDTRTDVGLTGPFVSGIAQTLQMSGNVSTQPPNNAPAVNAVVVPSGATSVVLNLTVVRPSTGGFISIRPGDASGVPATSNINWGAGGPNIANAVTVQLPTAGTVNLYVQGTVGDVLIDVAGYYQEDASGDTPGPTGDAGPTGDTGSPGPRGFSAWDVIPSGITVTGNVSWDSIVWADVEGDFAFDEDLPGVAPIALTDATVNIAPGSGALDEDPTCTGSVAAPTAPPGKVCVYVEDAWHASSLQGQSGYFFTDFLATRGFSIAFRYEAGTGSAGSDIAFNATWAYTAP